MQTEELAAGRELDALVAAKVMEGRTPPEWAYSSDMSSAWHVVERISGECYFELQHVADGEWFANFEGWGSAIADTAPLAICRAAMAEFLKS